MRVCTASRIPAGICGCSFVMMVCIHPEVPPPWEGGCREASSLKSLSRAAGMELPSLGGSWELELLLLGSVLLVTDLWFLSCLFLAEEQR